MVDQAAAPTRALGNSTDFASALPGGGLARRRAGPGVEVGDRAARRRSRRYALQDVAKALLPGHRCGVCRRALAPAAGYVALMYSDQVGRAHYKGLMVCGSVWVCPVCAATITEQRRAELAEGLAAHPELTPVLVTVTLQHDREDPLAELVDRLNEAWRWVHAGRWWQRLKARYALAGSVCGAETTWGAACGWHPHKHVLMLLELGPDQFDPLALEAELQERYTLAVAARGGYASPVYGLRVQVGDKAVGSYLAKWGITEELTKGTVKEGRQGGLTPWDLLARAGEGDIQAARLFVEYAEAMAGRSQLRYSRGLRGRLGLGAELTDEELATKEEERARVLAVLDRLAWLEVVRRGLRGALLEVASLGRRDAVEVYLEAYGIRVSDVDPDGSDP